jgi:hypothetical protein
MANKNIYNIYDVNGLVGELATILALQQFKKFILEEGYVATVEFILMGASLISRELADEIEAMESFDPDIQDTIVRLRELLIRANTVMIINMVDNKE